MILKKIYIENIRSYKKQEISFPRGSTLLSGDIGSGKTTILLAIEFALFGLQPGQKASSLLKNGENNAKIILEFEVDDKSVTIERSLKKNKTISQDSCSITINNERFEGSVTEIKNRVLQLLNYPLEFSKKTNLLYKFTVYTPQEEMKQIILEPRDIRLNTLRHVFGIDKYKRIEENTAIVTSKLRERIRTNEGSFYDLDNEKNNLQNKIDYLNELKEKQKKSILDYENSLKERELKEKSLNEIQEKINEKNSLLNEKEKSKILINEKQQQINSLNNLIKTLNLQIEEAEKIKFNKEEFDSLNQRIEFQNSKEEELNKNNIKTISSINSLESKKREAISLKEKISRLEKCPTCFQNVPEEYKRNIFENVEKEINEIDKNLSSLLDEKNLISDSLNNIKKIKEDFNKRKSEMDLIRIKLENLQEKKQRINESLSQKNSIEKDLELLNKHINNLDETIKNFEIYNSIFDERKKELELAKSKESKLAIKKAEINKEIQLIEINIKEIDKKIKEKQEIKNKTEKLREIEYWLSQKFLELILFTEKQVLLTLREEFSNLFSKWFSILVSDSLSARLDDEFTPIIEQEDYELDYSFLSGGERTAIALAYRLALNQVINSVLSKIKTRNLTILDEPTDGFSSQQLDKIRDVFNQLDVEQLILVSHEPKIESFVDNIIRFNKESGNSIVKQKV